MSLEQAMTEGADKMAEDAVKTIEGAGRTTAEVDKLYERMAN